MTPDLCPSIHHSDCSHAPARPPTPPNVRAKRGEGPARARLEAECAGGAHGLGGFPPEPKTKD